MAELSARSSVLLASILVCVSSILVHAPQSSLTPRSHNLSSSLPKLKVLGVVPMHDTVASHYLPSSS